MSTFLTSILLSDVIRVKDRAKCLISATPRFSSLIDLIVIALIDRPRHYLIVVYQLGRKLNQAHGLHKHYGVSFFFSIELEPISGMGTRVHKLQ
jgi:hypothetical protein